MSSDMDFKTIWVQQKSAAKPEITELIKSAAKVKNGIFKRLLLTNILLMATIIFVGYIGVSGEFSMATTRIGVILIILAIVFYITVSLGLLKEVFKTNPAADSVSYITELLSIRKKQANLQGIMMKLYFILLSAGLLLYMIEFLTRMTFLWAAITSIISFGWVLVNWLYFYPRMIRKHQKSLNDMIKKLEELGTSTSQL